LGGQTNGIRPGAELAGEEIRKKEAFVRRLRSAKTSVKEGDACLRVPKRCGGGDVGKKRTWSGRSKKMVARRRGEGKA